MWGFWGGLRRYYSDPDEDPYEGLLWTFQKIIFDLESFFGNDA